MSIVGSNKTSWWMCVLVCAPAALWVMSVPALARAQTRSEIRAPLSPSRAKIGPARVVLSSHFLFMELEPSPAAIPAQFRRVVERHMATRAELISFVSDDQATAALLGQRLYTDRLELAEQLAEQGIQNYKELNQAQAMRNLEKALEQYEAIRYDLIEPQRVANVLLYLALSYIEQDARLPQALRALRQMILLDPSIELKRGYDADKIVDLYEDARRTLQLELTKRGPRIEQLEQARELASRAGADYVIYGVIVPADGGYVLTLYPYSAQEGRFELGESLRVSRLDPELIEEVADRLAGRWSSCLAKPEQRVTGPPPSRGRGALSLSLGMSYMSFVKNPRPLEDLFGNYGLGLGARWLITREFGVVGGAQLLIAQRDRSGRIVNEDFPTFRGFLGGELGLELFSDLTLAVQLAGDITHVSEFKVWGDANCIPQNDCGKAPVEFADYGLMLGVNARPMVSYQFHEAVSAQLGASFSYFFYTGAGEDLNFPIGADLGVQYRF